MKILLRSLADTRGVDSGLMASSTVLVSTTVTSTVYKLACARDPYSTGIQHHNLRILYKNHIGG
jgi:hypothetical protein